MTRFKSTCIVFLALTLFASCAHLENQGAVSSPGAALHRIKQKGELVVGLSGNQPPFNATTKKGEIIGFEPDMAEMLAEAMGVKLRLLPMHFSQLLPALEAGRIDMIMSGMTMTSERNMTHAFVGPYYVSGKGLLTKFKGLASIKDSSEMDDPNTTLAALKGSTSQAFVEKNAPKARLILTENYDEGVDLVINDKVNAFVADFPICSLSVLRYPDKGLIPLVAPLTYEPIGIALPAGDYLLVNLVENFLRSLQGSGQMKKLDKRWFKRMEWLESLP